MRSALMTVLALLCALLGIGHAQTLAGAVDFHAHITMSRKNPARLLGLDA